MHLSLALTSSQRSYRFQSFITSVQIRAAVPPPIAAMTEIATTTSTTSKASSIVNSELSVPGADNPLAGLVVSTHSVQRKRQSYRVDLVSLPPCAFVLCVLFAVMSAAQGQGECVV